MAKKSNQCYYLGITPRELATKVLNDNFKDKMPSIPIDPFRLMRKYGVVYQFMEFEDLEGIYIVPEDDNDVALIGINYQRPITRQRFTAAHELCHHFKDRESDIYVAGAKSETESYAEKFAAELLMPEKIFCSAAKKYAIDGKVSLDDALYLAESFGVSFSSCVFRLAYTFKMLDGDYTNLSKRILEYKPESKKSKLGIKSENVNLFRQALDSYDFFFQIEENIIWFKFKNDFIYNENRMEGLKIKEREIAEIITDLRLNKQESRYCKKENEEIIQVLGHETLYEYIMNTKDTISIYKLLELNRKLFQFAPYPELAGKTREYNTLVLGAKFETEDYRNIPLELQKLQKPVEELSDKSDELSNSEYLLEALKIHHRITQIHPFRDGNGRTSRALLNWMLRYKGLPPIYFKASEKELYYHALQSADSQGECSELLYITIQELFRTMIQLNKR